MRLFVAADLPRDVREPLAAAAPPPPWRALPVDSLHVTLAFLGERGDPGAVAARLAGVTGTARAALAEAVLLPPRRPRVYAVRVTGMDELQAGVVEALEGLWEPEDRPFLGHVTLARARQTVRGEPGPAPHATFDVPSVSLYRSHPGSRYEALHVTTLHRS